MIDQRKRLEIEKERKFLLKEIPNFIFKKRKYRNEIIDIYVPAHISHPKIRLRRINNRFMLTKKVSLDKSGSRQNEITIPLDAREYKVFLRLKGKKLSKIRYSFPPTKKRNYKMEFDFYTSYLKGLNMVDFEFKSENDLKKFVPPKFCLAEVTHLEDLAAGKLAGKKIKNIFGLLNKLNYKIKIISDIYEK